MSVILLNTFNHVSASCNRLTLFIKNNNNTISPPTIHQILTKPRSS